MGEGVFFPVGRYVILVRKVVDVQKRNYHHIKLKPLSRMVGAVVYAGAVVPNLKDAMKSGRLAPEGPWYRVLELPAPIETVDSPPVPSEPLAPLIR